MRALTLFSILVLALPVASAATLGGTLEGSILRAQDVLLDGRLLALLQESVGSTQLAAPDFRLTAQQMHVETDTADPAVSNPVNPISVAPDTTPADFTGATLIGKARRDDYRFNVFPLDPSNPPALHVQASCATAQAYPATKLERSPIVAPQKRSTIQRDTHDATTWTCLEGASLSISGNFLLNLWSWDAHLNAPSQDFLTGTQPSTKDPTHTLEQHSEAFFRVTNGTLQIPNLTGVGYTVLTADRADLKTSILAADDASGWVAIGGNRHAFSHQPARFFGLPAVVLRRQGLALQATLGGEVKEAKLGAQTLVTAPTAPSNVAWLGVAAVLPVVALAWWARPLRHIDPRRLAEAPVFTEARGMREVYGTGWWVMARRALLEGKARQARRLARRASRWFPRSADSKMLQAIAELRLGKDVAALGTLDELLGLLADREERADFALLAAEASMRLGLLDKAYSCLSIAGSVDPMRFGQEIRRPIYDPLEARADFKALRHNWKRVVYDLFDPSFS